MDSFVREAHLKKSKKQLVGHIEFLRNELYKQATTAHKREGEKYKEYKEELEKLKKEIDKYKFLESLWIEASKADTETKEELRNHAYDLRTKLKAMEETTLQYADEMFKWGKEIADLKFENRKLESKLKNLENDYLCETDDLREQLNYAVYLMTEDQEADFFDAVERRKKKVEFMIEERKKKKEEE